MRLNRADLKKIIYDFNSISNRLINADFNDYLGIMRKYVAFVKTTPIIYDYVVDCGPCEKDMEQEFKEIRASYCRGIFDLGETDEEEVCNVFEIMSYIVDHDILVYRSVASGYTSSNQFQDKVKAFNDRVIMVFIHHMEAYLTKIGIDMGISYGTRIVINSIKKNKLDLKTIMETNPEQFVKYDFKPSFVSDMIDRIKNEK